jgi:iron complex outermembrane receptor protein
VCGADQVRFDLADHYFGDGAQRLRRSNHESREPDVRRHRRASPVHSLYASVGSAFETPTTTELATADGSAGLNRDLKPQFSTTYEVGAKASAFAGCSTTPRSSTPKCATS